MEGSESSRSRSKRDAEDNADAQGSRKGDDEEHEESDSRKSRSSRSRKHSYHDEAQERSESRKKPGASSSRAGSGDEDDFDVRRESSRSSKMLRRSPEDRAAKRSSDGYMDRDGNIGRNRIEEESDWDSSRRTGSKASGPESSQSKSRSKMDSPYDGDHERLNEKDVRSSERRESGRGREQLEQDEKTSHRRSDEVYASQRANERGSADRDDARDRKSSDQHKHQSGRGTDHEYRNEYAESRIEDADSGSLRGGSRSDNKEERWEDGERKKGSARLETCDEENKLVDTRRECGSNVGIDDMLELDIVQETSSSLLDGAEQSDLRYSTKAEEIGEKLRHQLASAHESHNDVEMRDKPSNLDEDGQSLLMDRSNADLGHVRSSRTFERPGRFNRETDEHVRGNSDSDNERSIASKDKSREEAYGDDKSYKGRERNWKDKGRGHEGSNDYWRRSKTRQDSQDADNFDPVVDWRHGQEWLDGGNFHGRSGYRKESRLRSESGKGSSAFGNRYDSSDSIEIRPNRNLDFGREGSVSGRRPDMGSQQEFPLGANDDIWISPPEDRAKTIYGYSNDAQEKYYDDGPNMDQNSSRSSIEFSSGRGRGFKGAIASQGAGSGLISPGSSQTSGSFNRDSQQGPKGGRPARGGRGRTNGRDAQRIAVPMPIMGPRPFGHLGLPPGPMQPMGPNIAHVPGPTIGPGTFIPPFPGPLVWPGARGIDVSMLGVPPNLPRIPPVPAGPRFAPGPSHNIHLTQPGPGIGTPPNVTGPGFNAIGTPTREMPHEKAPTGWTPHRNSGPAGKAPSRGEQNDYSQNFVDTGMRPQNFIRELDHTSIVEDYPKLRELIQRKDDIVKDSATPPMYYKCDLREQVLSPEFFGSKFDVILVDPPWEEYAHRGAGIIDHMDCWPHEEIMNLKIEAIADTPSFIFLWVGDGVGLEQGRQCLKKWGFRRCEDICWVKTNKTRATGALRHDSHTLFQHSKEHCLMGIKGTVRRSTDGHIIHANIDTDIIIAEEPIDGSTKKPDDMYRIIEHFALGKRRLELFGEDHNIRPGWLTLGKDLTSTNFNKETYIKNFADKDGKVWQGGGGRNPPPGVPHLVQTTDEIEGLRPKSPPQKGQPQHSMPPLGSGGSSNRRPFGNSAQSAVTVIGSETPSHTPWSSSPVVTFGMPDGGAALDSNIFDSYGFNNPFSRTAGDHADFESHRAANLF